MKFPDSFLKRILLKAAKKSVSSVSSVFQQIRVIPSKNPRHPK
jgi:hypothetical protein